MGAMCTSPQIEVLMTGPESVGKTSILYRAKLKEFTQVVPTVGVVTEIIEAGGRQLKVTDMNQPMLISQFLEDSRALIFVVRA